jgi:hypothetical protein
MYNYINLLEKEKRKFNSFRFSRRFLSPRKRTNHATFQVLYLKLINFINLKISWLRRKSALASREKEKILTIVSC